MPQVTFFVAGDPSTVRNTLDGVLTQLGFQTKYSDDWNGVAERGSKAATFWIGAFAGKSQHMRMHLSLAIDPNGNVALTAGTGTTGLAAGVIGASRADTAYAQVFDSLRTTFSQAGVLLGEQRA
ncbi:MAG: hypothetical protein LBJ02_05535 [Bifidobacteriaceae bacterium]|jgi:hypothetical protein|nr:hypothetical protein [Bifidobacteriaceae bacterium]